MNNTCGTCGGFVGNFMYAGDGARICNCANSDILKGERRRVIEQIRHEEREHTKQLILIKFLPHKINKPPEWGIVFITVQRMSS